MIVETNIMTDTNEAYSYLYDREHDIFVEQVALSPVLQEFIERFDALAYPNLVDEDAIFDEAC